MSSYCRCGHTRPAHEVDGMQPQCVGTGCTCLNFRPAEPPRPGPLATPARVPLPEPKTDSRGFAQPVPAPTAVATPRPVNGLKRPVEAKQTPDPKPEPQRVDGPTVEQLIAAGRRSDVKATVALAERVTAAVDELRARVAEDTRTAQLRHEIAELERTLAEKKAQLGSTRSATRNAAAEDAKQPTGGEFACPDCGKTFGRTQALGSHRARVHGYRRTA